jgi:Ser-tRNA(Ala) deacylase AlaX
MVRKRYLEEHTLYGKATVTETGADERGAWVRLSETVFHPQGGGQKADRGTIGGAAVLHVAHSEGGEVNHYVEEAAPFVVGQEVEIVVDAGWREMNARLHTGGHLFAAVAEERWPALVAVAGHHWPGEARVEFEIGEGAIPAGEELSAVLQKSLEEAIQADLPVRVVGDPYSSRAIQIAAHRAIPCGGTHLDRTGALAGLAVTSVRTKSGRLRISYEDLSPTTITGCRS